MLVCVNDANIEQGKAFLARPRSINRHHSFVWTSVDHECVNCAGIEQGKAFLAKAKEFESAALESALAAQLEREGMQERLRDQQQLLEDTVQVSALHS